MVCYLYINSAAVISKLRKVVCLFLKADEGIWGRTSHRWPCCWGRVEPWTCSFWKLWKASLRTITHSTNPSIYEWISERWRVEDSDLLCDSVNEWQSKCMIRNNWSDSEIKTPSRVLQVSTLCFVFKLNCVFSETSICKTHISLQLACVWRCVWESSDVPFSPTTFDLNTDFSARFSLLLLTTTRPDLAQCPPCAVIIPDLANMPGVCNQPWALFVCRVLQSWNVSLLSVGLAA